MALGNFCYWSHACRALRRIGTSDASLHRLAGSLALFMPSTSLALDTVHRRNQELDAAVRSGAVPSSHHHHHPHHDHSRPGGREQQDQGVVGETEAGAEVQQAGAVAQVEFFDHVAWLATLSPRLAMMLQVGVVQQQQLYQMPCWQRQCCACCTLDVSQAYIAVCALDVTHGRRTRDRPFLIPLCTRRALWAVSPRMRPPARPRGTGRGRRSRRTGTDSAGDCCCFCCSITLSTCIYVS